MTFAADTFAAAAFGGDIAAAAVRTENVPTINLYWSTTTGPLEEPVWETFPETADGRSRIRLDPPIVISRGRDTPHDPFDAGTMTFTVDNRDRELDPLNSSSTVLAGLRPNVPVKLTATWQGTERTLFVGFVDGWPLATDVSQNDATVTLDCTDLTKILALRDLRTSLPWILDDATYGVLDAGYRVDDPTPLFAATTTSGRVAQVGDVVAIPSSMLDVDDAWTTVAADLPETGTYLLDYLDRVARTEQGRLFVSKDGALTFRGRLSWGRYETERTAQLVFADDTTYALPVVSYLLDAVTVDTVRNDIRRSVPDGPVAVAIDTDSVRLYGGQQDEQTDLMFANRSEPAAAAVAFLARWAEPVPTYRQITFTPARSTNPDVFGIVCDLDLGSRVAVSMQPMSTGTRFTQQCTIERADIEIGEMWTVTYGLSEADTTDYWTLDDPTLGLLDAAYMVAY